MRRTQLLFLLGTTMLASQPALAQAVPVTVNNGNGAAAGQGTSTGSNAETGPASGASTTGSLPTDIARNTESVTVTGHNPKRTAIGGGLMVQEEAPKSRSTITQAYIEKQAATSNPFQLLRMLPGVNQGSPDPFGLTGGNITIRGLGTSEIGYTLEGVPINDVGSAATYPQEISDAQNLSQISINQGSADLDSPVVNAAGGIINTYLRDPAMKPGAFLQGSYGSYSLTQGFVRLDTGLIGNTNLRGWVSYSKTSDLHWRGPGTDDKSHAEMKFVNDWGQGNRVSLAFVINQGDSNEYPSASAAQWHQYGYGGNNAIGVTAGTVYDHNFYKNDGNFIGVKVNPFTNIYTSAPSNFTLTDHLSFSTVPYLWYGYGNGGGAYSTNLSSITWGNTTQTATINGQKVSGTSVFLYEPSITETYRPGINSKFTYETGRNKAVVGYWFEYSHQMQTAPYSFVEGDGHPLNEWGDESNVILSNGQKYQYRHATTVTHINTAYIGDSYTMLNDRLTLDAGLKYAIVVRDGHNFLPNVSIVSPETDDEHALPTASVSYKINPHNQVFASVATNFHTPTNSTLYDAGTYSTKTHTYSTQPNVNQKAEVSISEEAGYRYQGKLFDLSATYFHYNFTDRQLSTTAYDSSGNSYSTNINAGGQHSDGIDFEAGMRPFHNFRPYVSGELLHAVVDSNIQNGLDYVRSAGKLVPGTPQVTAALGIDYDNGHLFGNVDVKYQGHQYADYMNTEAINGYTTVDATIGYRFRDQFHLKAPTLQLNVINATNEKYLSYVSTVTTNAQATRGVFGTTMAAKTPYYGVGEGAAAIATFSVGF